MYIAVTNQISCEAELHVDFVELFSTSKIFYQHVISQVLAWYVDILLCWSELY